MARVDFQADHDNPLPRTSRLRCCVPRSCHARTTDQITPERRDDLVRDRGCWLGQDHVQRALVTSERIVFRVCVFDGTQAPRRRVPCAVGGGCKPPAVQATTQYTEWWCREPGRTRGSLFVGERSSPKICEDPRFDTLGVAPPARRRTRMDHRDYLSDQQQHQHREKSAKSLASLEWTRSFHASIRLAQSPFSFFPFSRVSVFFFFYSSPFIFAERNKITKKRKIKGTSPRCCSDIYTSDNVPN